jgi:TldD protein
LWLGGCAEAPQQPGARQPPTIAPAAGSAGPVEKTTWQALAQLALARIKALGCDYGDIRLIETQNESIRAEDRRIAAVSSRFDSGYGIRALYKGAWGFAAANEFTPEAVEATAARAVEVAQASHVLLRQPVVLAEEPVHIDKVKTPFLTDPFAVPLDVKCGLLIQGMEILHREKGILRSNAFLWAQRDIKHFASTEGTAIDFDLLAVGGSLGATAKKDADFQSRNYNISLARAGWEHVVAADMIAKAPLVAAQAVEKAAARQPSPGKYDLVLDGEHLSLTIHESCGHPTELDRALGYEANFAGTSFLTPDNLGKYRYGSKHVNLVADNTRPGALGSTGYDDDGVAGQRWPIVEEGILRGYSTSREVARAIGEKRSRGSSRADGWQSVPIVRIANVGLEPGSETLDSLIGGIDNGILIEGHGSFSIDQRRYNFQFGGDAFWEIKKGKRGGMLKNVIYNGITPEFWGSCDGVANKSFWQQHGFITCGKGQPSQSGWMTHAASPARFRGVSVIDPKGEMKG